jgi:transcriptional regulator with XRE-family HTH domain
VDALRLGTVSRTLRIKRGWRQEDLAVRAGVTRSDVSRLERGLIGVLDVDVVVRTIAALGGRLGFTVFWHGGDLDRLLNARHSALHESVAHLLKSSPGWEIAPEVSFAIRGERGIIDILAWHASTKTLLVIELKTELVDLNELLGTIDRKRRLAPTIARDRGWSPLRVAVWVVVGDSKTNRRRAQAHASMLRSALGSDGRTVRTWLHRPITSLACLSFWSNAHGVRSKSDFATVKRIRAPNRRCA